MNLGERHGGGRDLEDRREEAMPKMCCMREEYILFLFIFFKLSHGGAWLPAFRCHVNWQARALLGTVSQASAMQTWLAQECHPHVCSSFPNPRVSLNECTSPEGSLLTLISHHKQSPDSQGTVSASWHQGWVQSASAPPGHYTQLTFHFPSLQKR